MTNERLLIALMLYLIAVVATLGIGAFLLRNAVKDASDLISQLPTRFVEDTSAARKSNRRTAYWELLSLLCVRSLPGGLLVFCGVGLLVWILYMSMSLFFSP